MGRSPIRSGCLLLLSLALAHTAYGAAGTSSSSVGKDLVVKTPPAAPSKPSAQALPRRAGPQLRQGGIATPGLLPDCVPADGVICSDRDYTGILQVAPAVIDLADDNYAFLGLTPSAEVSVGPETKVGLVDGSFSSDLKASAKAEVKASAGDQVYTAGTEATTTALGAKLSTRPDLLLPSKLALTLGKVDSEDKVEWRTNKPNFYYVLGQNLGLPIGFQTVSDGVAGRK